MCGAAGMAMLGLVIAGCGSSGSEVTAGPISVTSPSGAKGQLSSLAAASTVRLSMMPTGDKSNAGVDWALTCGGNPVTGSITNGACGTLSPAHTADGAATLFTAPSVPPLGTTVTIKASVTRNPSQNSSVSLTVVAQPIAVSFAEPVPSSLLVNGTTGAAALVTNDPANVGVIWTATCGSSVCGSFNPTITPSSFGTTFTAPSTVPADGMVTITATSLTDTTKSVRATIAVTAPPMNALAVTISPASFYVSTSGATRTVHVIASVTNDSAAAGVDWLLTCGASNCGTFTAHTASGSPMTFIGPTTVPTGGEVTITAKSTTDPTKSASAIATVQTAAPIAVTILPALPATLMTGVQAALAATVTSDKSNLGVNWTATCGSAGACGTFSLSPAHTASGGHITYTAPGKVPAGDVVTITASSAASTPSNPAITATTILVQPPTIAFAQAPPGTLTSGTQATVSAIVTNDVAPGGVTWTLQCTGSVPGGCGTIVPYQTTSGGIATYTAPPVTSSGTLVTINAASTATPSVSVSSTPVAINPSTGFSIRFTPLAPSQVQADTTVNLEASVTNDSTNGGVDWQICASGCGLFTTQAAIPATATTPFVPAVTATTVTAWSNGLPLAYTAPSQPPPSGSVVVLIAAHASPTTADSATLAIGAGASGPALHGMVQAGTQPVVGASVALYAAGTSGYASASTQVSAPGGAATSTTDNHGNFTVPAGYNCPRPNSQMYLVATGGKVGANAANPNLALMTVLGSCSNLSSSAVMVNEVTSVASAFVTAPFASNDALSGNNSYLYIGASSTNSMGVANAFAAVNNFVDISTGQVRFTVPAGNATVPYPEIDTLADILNVCTASAGGVEGDGSACSSLFTATDVLPNHSIYNSVAPSDTLQAIFNLAQHPVSNYGYQIDGNNQSPLFSLASPASPFQPILPAKPNDWSISLNYTGGGGLSTASTVGSLAIDAVGNLWITDTANRSAIEWNALGAALSPSAGFPAGGGPIAIDATGNIWISGNGSLTELTELGSPVQGSPFGGVSGGGADMAIDTQTNLWITDTGGVHEFNNLGTEISPVKGYTNSGVTGVTAVGVDSSNNVWVMNAPGSYDLAELTNPGGQLIVNAPGIAGVTTIVPELAADGAGDIWSLSGPRVCKVPPYGGKATILLQTCYQEGGGSISFVGYNFFDAGGIAVDGAGTVWVASQGGSTSPTIPPSVLPFVPSLLATPNYPNYYVSTALSAGPLRLAVDGSGNLWILQANNTVTEYVGLATPVVTPIALGLKNKKLAAKP